MGLIGTNRNLRCGRLLLHGLESQPPRHRQSPRQFLDILLSGRPSEMRFPHRLDTQGHNHPPTQPPPKTLSRTTSHPFLSIDHQRPRNNHRIRCSQPPLLLPIQSARRIPNRGPDPRCPRVRRREGIPNDSSRRPRMRLPRRPKDAKSRR